MPESQDDGPKLHIDSDWKAQAQAEKERLGGKEAERQQQSDDGGLPPADFRGLLGLLASQALSGLGMYGDQKTGRVIVDLQTSRFAIDLLAILEEKTKGNLSDEEADELKQLLSELRSRFVQISQLVAKQQAEGAEGGAADASKLHLVDE